MAEWSYLLADLRTNAILYEPALTAVTMNKPLNESGALTASWFLGSRRLPASLNPYELTRPGRTAIYALRDGTPFWGGIVWTTRYDSRDEKLTLGAADWWSYYHHRKLLPVLAAPEHADPNDIYTVAKKSLIWIDREQNQLARDLLAYAHAHTGGDIGVTSTTGNSGTARTLKVYGFELTDIGDSLRRLAELDGGPDIAFDVGAVDSTGAPRRLMRIGTPSLGQPGAPWIFEYGANMLAYTWPSDATRMSTRTFAVGTGQERTARIGRAEDATAADDGWPLLESDQQYSTVNLPDDLISHATADLAANRRPVVLPELVVRGTATPTLGTYSPGDTCRLSITDRLFPNGREETVRVVNIAVSPSDGVEQVTVTVAPVLDD